MRQDYTVNHTGRQTRQIKERPLLVSSLLSRGGDVELVLQDVVNHWLSQVVHYVAVSMLESQSTEQM